MPQIAVPGTAEISVNGTGPNNNEWSLVFHAARRGASVTPFTDAQVTTIIDDVVDWAEVTLDTVMTSDFAITTVRARDISQVPYGNPQEQELLEVGQIATESCPPQSALVVTKLTPFSGRRTRGRFYHPSIPEAEQSGGLVSVDFADDVLAAYEVLRTALDVADPNGWVLSVASRTAPGKAAVTALRINRRVDTQRRRAGRT